MSWLRLPTRPLGNVAAGVVLLAGCAAPTVEVTPAPPAPPRERIAARPGRPGFVVAVPHGGSDLAADDIAQDIARRTGFGLVIASDSARASSPGRAWETRLRETAQGPLRLYAEIERSDRKECGGRIEIGTVGVDRELALRLRTLAELIRDAHLRANAEVDRLDVLVEPADTVRARGTDALSAAAERGLRIELPRCGRRDWRETYTAILADFLAQAGTLPAGR